MEQNQQEMKDYLKKRKYPRRRYVKPLGLLIHGTYFMSRCEEIGEGGVLVSTPQQVRIGESVILSIMLPENEIAIVRATIRYVIKKDLTETNNYPYQLGIQFHTLSFKFKKKVRDYIAAKSEQEAMSDLDGYEKLTEIITQ